MSASTSSQRECRLPSAVRLSPISDPRSQGCPFALCKQHTMPITRSLALALVFCAGVCVATDSSWWGGTGDPIFRGLDGRTFFFDGIAGKTFSILSEQDHQLNADFSVGPHKIDNLGKKTVGTFMTAFGLQMYKTKVEMHVTEEGNVTVAVNGVDSDKLLNATNDFSLKFEEPDAVTITVERYRSGYGYTVVARSALLELVMYSTGKEFDPIAKELARAHLNFDMGVDPEALKVTEMHGVLGQNHNNRASDTALIPDALNNLFLGEGEDVDYIVSGLFATDSKFNLFGKQQIVKASSGERPASNGLHSLKLSASRRLM